MNDRNNMISMIEDALGSGGSHELAEQVYRVLRADGRIDYDPQLGLVMADGVDLLAVAEDVLKGE